MQILDVDDLRCVQFLRGGKVCVSFREQADRDHFLSEGMRLDDEDIPVTRDAEKVTVLYIRDLPYEVASDDVVDFFSTFGEVLTVERSVAAETPSLCNGNRVLKMVLKGNLPYFISICGYQCRVWYRGQPIQCFVCRQSGHRAQACPLSGRCRYCHQAGHMARDCAQAWDPTPPAVPVDIRTDVDASSVSDSSTIMADDPSVVPDSDPIPMSVSPDPPEDNLPAAVPDKVPVSSKSSNADKPANPVADPVVVKVTDKSPDPVKVVDPVKVTDKSSDVPMPARASKSSPPAVDPVKVVDPAKVTDKSSDVPMPARASKSSPPAVDPVKVVDPAKVTDKSSDVPMPARASKSSRTTVTAKIFCARLSKNFDLLRFPDFGDISDKERDSRAKAHLRAQIKAVFNFKDMDVHSSDIRKWSESDLCEISSLFSKMLSVPDHLVDFVSSVTKSYWNTAKSKHK